jgi:hypothetical protein
MKENVLGEILVKYVGERPDGKGDFVVSLALNSLHFKDEIESRRKIFGTIPVSKWIEMATSSYEAAKRDWVAYPELKKEQPVVTLSISMDLSCEKLREFWVPGFGGVTGIQEVNLIVQFVRDLYKEENELF